MIIKLDSLCIYLSWVFKTTDSLIILNIYTCTGMPARQQDEKEKKNEKKIKARIIFLKIDKLQVAN